MPVDGYIGGAHGVLDAWELRRHLLNTLAELQVLGVDLYLHQQAVDTTTPAGRALFQMMGAIAEFERAMIRERIHAGPARTRAQGMRLGRPPVGGERVGCILQTLAAGHGVRITARTGGVSYGIFAGVLQPLEERQLVTILTKTFQEQG